MKRKLRSDKFVRRLTEKRCIACERPVVLLVNVENELSVLNTYTRPL